MKPSLLLIVLLSVLQVQISVADTTLNYNLFQNGQNSQQLSYQLREHHLRLTDNVSKRINLFDSDSQQFVSQRQGSDQFSMLNMEILEQRVNQLNQKRMQEVAEIEKKLQARLNTMSTKEQEVGVGVINQLKYPDLYGEHTLLRTYTTGKTKTIDGIECEVIQLKREATLLKEYCMAGSKELGLSAKEYKTLRSFYRFDYTSQSRIMLAMGKSRFDIIDYDKHEMPGVVIEMNTYKDNKLQQQLVLAGVNHKPLKEGLFSLAPPAARPQGK